MQKNVIYPFKQLFPYALPHYLQFAKDKNNLIQRLNKKVFPHIDFKQYDFNPYPLLLSHSLIAQIEEAHSLLTKAVTQIVTHYFKDPKLQSILSLPDKTLNLLASCQHKPYQLGAIRPDFLFDHDYHIKICEINARFPSNMFIFTEHLYEEMFQQYNLPSFNLSKPSINSTSTIQSFFDPKKSIHILIGKEKSTEIYLLKNKLLSTLSHPKLLALSTQENQQFILNLQQEELLALDPQQFTQITASTYFNDIRTVFIAHDKRLFAILCNQDIMSKYMTADEFKRLSHYIIPTYLIEEKIKRDLSANTDAWVLKKFTGGKGKGMTIGKATPPSLFKKILQTAALDTIAQPFIEQPLFNLINYHTDTKNSHASLYLVGSILSFNNQLLGPGLFRASVKTVINAASGATFFTPLY
ncbi:uncharacterized protein RVIR1_08710 [Candidatus Rickettsiella viridis]|uniref:Glutathionylspermidine synthase n=1 Tax=Candidatus Rickettsiella viridis TaxID=676208 RepID=A0A2Z5UV49_9COXI|nr:hypothetical protein [Candidatus Rickettsiella viridis]BBB15354.1 uncharacterized protein RVIR1_08710 [Candidatus Rickettsiella viridis]